MTAKGKKPPNKMFRRLGVGQCVRRRWLCGPALSSGSRQARSSRNHHRQRP
jgi:hypothetical protein